MADVELVQGDTRPSLDGTIRRTVSGDPLDLTNADSVKFQMRKDDDRHYTVDAAATFIDKPTGRVRYEWEEGDLNNPGDYIGQWEIVWNDDTVQTTFPANTISVRRQ